MSQAVAAVGDLPGLPIRLGIGFSARPAPARRTHAHSESPRSVRSLRLGRRREGKPGAVCTQIRTQTDRALFGHATITRIGVPACTTA